MTTALANPIPAPTPQHDKSLTPQGLADHRQQIAFEVKAVLSAYFQPHEADEVRAAQLAWWCDELQEWTLEQVVWALRRWNRDNPRVRPTPGDIVAVCKKERGRKMAARLPKPEENVGPVQRVTRERAAEILAEVGFKPKRMEGEG